MASPQEAPRSFASSTNSYLPSSLIEFLEASSPTAPQSQPQAAESEPSKLRAKRRRISAASSAAAPVNNAKPIQYIVLRRTTINIKFPRSSEDRGKNVCYQSSQQIQIDLERLDAQTFNIRLYSLPTSQTQDIPYLLDTKLSAEELPLRDVEIAMLSDVQWSRRFSGQGKLWTDTTLILHREDGIDHLAITIEVKWEKTETSAHVPPFRPRAMLKQCLDKYLPGLSDDEYGEHTTHTFYNCSHTPDKHVTSPLETPDVRSELYPFQKRAVTWLLRREGVQFESGHLTAFEEGALDANGLPPSFTKTVDDEGLIFYFSSEMNLVTTDIAPFKGSVPKLRGGILAEEMGLGKTLEIISLITLHKFPLSGSRFAIPDGVDIADDVLPIKATLIVVPSPLLSQWISEIGHHSPTLKVFHYDGFKNSKLSFEELRQMFAEQDIVVTTYDCLSSEIHFARPAPERRMRNARKYERATSPLTKCLWWRVCLDEAQMIQGGVSAAAQVAQMIPRVNAWGISGTPVKRGIADLHGLLIFLRYMPYSSNYNLWTHLLHSPRNFARCFENIALRHTKAFVKNELELPPQKRFVITMPFTPIEEQHYQTLFQQMAADCNLDLNGRPLKQEWVPPYSKMRAWLIRLRQSALHPEVGGHNRRALGRASGPLRTLDEIVVAMLDQMDQAIRVDERSRLVSKLKRGQMLENSPRVKEALELWSSVVRESSNICDEIRKQLEQEVGVTSKKQRESADSDEEEVQYGEESSNTGVIRNRLKSALEVKHMAVFFQSNAYFQIRNNIEMTQPDSLEFKELEKKEVDGYAHAKALRHEILQEVFNKATRLMGKVSKKTIEQKFVKIPRISSNMPQGSNVEIRKVIGPLAKLGAVLDAQAHQLIQWRNSAVEVLTKSLVDEDDEVEITGDEYEESTKTQEEVMVLIMALRSLISDRHDLLTGQHNLRTFEEVKSALALAEAGNGPYPQKTIELLNIRQSLYPSTEVKSLRAIVSEARSLASELRVMVGNGATRHQMDLRIIETELFNAQKQLTEQLKITQALELEIELLTSTMNIRLEFYRQLQQISDTVAPYEGDLSDATMEYKIREENILSDAIAAAQTKRRYFEHLRYSKGARTCIICQEEFEAGVFTRCGHAFCKPDFKLWFDAHKNCPLCKERLGANDVQNIICKSQVLQGQEDSAMTDEEHGIKISKKSKIYSEISKETLEQIKDVNLGHGGSSTFTTKVDTLAKHIIWLRQTDPGAKSIIFCQYKEFLHVLASAFTTYKIGHESIEKKGGIDRFKDDPSKEVFLLHARAHASGLNLTNANHVFLCEPLLQTALELQAIARVDRIGQKHTTTVWLYLIDGTVEESIYDISVARRLEHMGKSKKGKSRETSVDPDISEHNIALANSMELQEAGLTNLFTKNEAGGEVVPDHELWQCLFGSRKRGQAIPDAADGEVGPSP